LLALTVASSLLLTACESASINESAARRINSQATAGSRAAAPVSPALPAIALSGSLDYRLGPLDVLDVEVLGSKEMTRMVRVSATGDFTLPLLGTIHAAGKSVIELQQDMAKQLEEHFLENPQVTVFVREYLSQRVTVEGAVKSPGIFPLTGRMSLLQIMALSGGLDQNANPAGIVVYRTIEGRRHAAVFDIRKVRAGNMVDPEVVGSDIVVVDYSGTRSGLRDFLSSTPLLALFLAL
jgi:polysaccharide export outer membrane protein